MAGEQRWSVVALPSPAWAKKVFPDLSETEAVDKLWPLVLKAARADGENPIEEWKQHDENFTKNVNYLNEQQFSALRFITGLGTDITIGLVKNHRWAGGSDVAKDGIRFFPNIPTEEVFTMPHREKADGHVVASMPLSYQGNLIEDFEFTFKDGKVVSYKAKTNEHLLKNMVEMDDGAARLGEVAIVPNSSPIGQMNTLFYNTLFDENASAHLALGKAYPNNIQDGDSLPLETLIEQGGNDSLIHVDFMFGTPDMKIIGIKDDGTEICFFNHGAYL